MLVAIDPGTYSTGLAIFDNATVLRFAGVCLPPKGQPLERFANRIIWHPMVQRTFETLWTEGLSHRCVIERPHDQGRSTTDRLLVLGEFVGMLRVAWQKTFNSYAEVIRPDEWKGTVPKPKLRSGQEYIIARRVNRLLTAAERQRVEVPSRVDYQWDVFDAIGLGLVHYNRARKGVK